MEELLLIWLLTFTLVSSYPSHDVSSSSPPVVEPVTDFCGGQQRMEVLPGRGWDNLRHKDMGQVLQVTYDKCRTTEDKLYLLPDNVLATPIKESDLQLTSELIEHWSTYTSVTAKSFQLNIGANIGSWGISGSFSDGYQNMKQHQVDDKSMTTRIQLRTSSYNVHASPASQIDPDLKKLFLEALRELENENTEKVDLILELIVRDYGTHYITQAEAGAVLYEEDFVKSNFVVDNTADKSQITAAAGVSFLNKFNFGAKYQQSVTNTISQGYRANQTSSNVKAIGGQTLTPNLTVDEWVKNLGNNLVMTDRFGDPLSYLISPQKFENVSLPLLGRLRKEVQDAVDRYYSYNTHIGCMNMDSPNFDYTANKEEDSCQHAKNNYTLGGVFQTCKMLHRDADVGDLCNQLEQKNYLTGGFTCPTNYTQVLLHAGTASTTSKGRACHQVCTRSWRRLWLWETCHDDCSLVDKISESSYESFWCVDVDNVTEKSGFMFGGLFTDVKSNPITSSQSCPPTYTAMKLGQKLKICISDDYELGIKYAIPFGGFFSCSQGNPLVTNGRLPLAKSCPQGHSQHLATIDDDCEIHYCIKANVLSTHGLTAVVRPPFTDMTKLYMNTMAMMNTTPAKPYVAESLSGGSVAGIVIACLSCVVITVGIVYYRKRQNRQAINDTSTIAEDQEPLLENAEDEPNVNDYGSINRSATPNDTVVVVQ